MRLISFAQENEDIYLYMVLHDYVKRGNYVDIGANDPTKLSVTKFFYDRGWTGLNIEPLDDMYKYLCEERLYDENLNMGVSDKKGTLELTVMGTGSTFCETVGEQQRITKPVDTFENIWRNSRFKNKEIHFCKIDVEGFEKNVLQGINFGEFQPWILLIESCLPGTNVPCYEMWEDILFEHEYILAFSTGINRYYLHRSKEWLLAGFKKIEDVKQFLTQNEIWKINYIDSQYYKNMEILEKTKRRIAFGTGNYFLNYMRYFGEIFPLEIAVDNCEEKWNKEIKGLKVYSPDKLFDYSNDEYDIIICCEDETEISEQLEKMQIHKWIHYRYVKG